MALLCAAIIIIIIIIIIIWLKYLNINVYKNLLRNTDLKIENLKAQWTPFPSSQDIKLP